jgi:hypothetical protein
MIANSINSAMPSLREALPTVGAAIANFFLEKFIKNTYLFTNQNKA